MFSLLYDVDVFLTIQDVRLKNFYRIHIKSGVKKIHDFVCHIQNYPKWIFLKSSEATSWKYPTTGRVISLIN